MATVSAGLIPLAVDYIRSNLRSIVISGAFSLTGTGLSTYGLFKHQNIFLIIGPIIALMGKILLGSIFLYPIVRSKYNKWRTARIESFQQPEITTSIHDEILN